MCCAHRRAKACAALTWRGSAWRVALDLLLTYDLVTESPLDESYDALPEEPFRLFVACPNHKDQASWAGR